jgi:hypothetical protein
MSNSTKNPITFALNAMNHLINSHGEFTFSEEVQEPLVVRARLQNHSELKVIQSLNDLNKNESNVWFHESSNSYILLRENSCNGHNDCYLTHSDIAISATTHAGLVVAIALYEGIEGDSLDQLMAQISKEYQS